MGRRRDKIKRDKTRGSVCMTNTISRNNECGAVLELSEQDSIPARMSIEPTSLCGGDIPFSLVGAAEGLDSVGLGSRCTEIGLDSAE